VPSETLWEFPYELPRNAFNARDAARAGDIWRAFQDVAVGAAARAGWPPHRFREYGAAFVVRSQTVVHHRETHFGVRLRGQSWVTRFRRETLCSREVRLLAEDGPVADGVQEWVHVNEDGKACRAHPQVVADLREHEGGSPSPTMPVFDPVDDGVAFRIELPILFVTMDPLDHVNHPAYVDFVDESLAHLMFARGIAPLDVVPIAETVTFYAPIVAPGPVNVESRLVGFTAEGAAVFDHVVGTEAIPRSATARTIRTLAADPSRLLALRVRDAV
jgi:acyl-CoA thioesterase FadM